MFGIARNIQALAWTVLLAAFALFLLLVLGGPWLSLRYLRQASVVPEVQVEAVRGALLLSRGAEQVVLLPDEGPRSLPEGWTIFTADAASEAFIAFADGPLPGPQPGSVVRLQPQTRLRLDRVRRARFSLGRQPPLIELSASPADAFVGGLTASSAWGRRDVRILIPDPRGTGRVGTVELAPESRVQMDFLASGSFRSLNQQGAVTVTNSLGQATLAMGQHSLTRLGQAPEAPTAGPRNVVQNDGFDNDLGPQNWAFGQRLPDRPVDPGRAFRERAAAAASEAGGERSVLRFERRGSDGSSADLFFQQWLGLDGPAASPGSDPAEVEGLDVRRAQFIGVSAVLRVLEQSLPGGGQADSEYPLILRLRSIDRSAANPDGCEWMVGFYAVPPPEGRPAPAQGIAVPAGVWQSYQSGNLLDRGNPQSLANRGCPVPTHLIRIEVGTSGHDFVSEVDQLAVWVE